MGQVRHGSATTTHAVRAAIQRSQASLSELSRDLGINPKTVAKWRKRQTVEDQKTGPRTPRSTVLSEQEEAMIVAFRRHTLLPLDDCLYALQPSIPNLSRSSLHRCLQRHGISRLPDVAGDKPKRQKFKRYPIGFFHIDIAAVQTAQGKLYLFVGIDRTSKFAVTQLVEKADRRTAWEFLHHMLEAVPYQVHTILTDNGIQFAEQPRNRNTAYSRPMRFDMICEANGIEHRLTKSNHPWTNGQVERMNRTIKEGEAEQKTIRGIVFPLNVKRFHYDSHDQLRTHLTDFMAAYNFARRLKTLGGLTPYEYICKVWTSEPDRFILDPIHQMPGLNTLDPFEALPRFCYLKSGEKIDNITDWALNKFTKHYGRAAKITKDDIFAYVYAVLHDPVYRETYAINLKREFPRIPFYPDFHQWRDWGQALLDLHIGYETVEPWPLTRTDTLDERAEKAGLSPKPALKADKAEGTIKLDSETTLSGIPEECWDYKLGNRSGLEWILDQYKEKTPRDPTIREKFNTYRFADYKEEVIDLIMRVTRVSVETMAITEAMSRARREAGPGDSTEKQEPH
ncbi:IS481 family transposase [Roseovarius sp. A46]|uniref:IS481 family transposase n=1 Tax=Roseovarius sp. A46 TaxID=2109331 RepID=UPI001F50560B|nr:IS481 family transposase [Roseovarius sp. A46]